MAGRDVDLSCRCGKLTGRLLGASPATGCRVTCHCKDCRAFATHVGGADLLDRNGGTELYQTLPARLEITSGRQHLRALRLSPKGMMRWYAGCCGTPVGNTLAGPGWYFLSLVVALVPEEQAAALGPNRGTFFAKDAPEGAEPPADHGKWGLLSGAFGRHFAAVLGLAPKGSPLFEGGRPVVEPEVLTKEQRVKAEAV
ncbi:MAG: DUF6151 family protein [Roseovarius sp.]|uniref:DUF6151 family protein n=1 Tax=Roseovarius sp. TaxID=1486281 RepID=UPI0032EF22D9